MTQPPQPPDANYQRYSAKALPPYTYIPGFNPHPQRDPKGHSYNQQSSSPLEYMPPEEWQKNQNYLYGVDLYNYAFWWESHEAWEEVWHTTDKDKHYGQFLQGLIQISAAFIKWHLHQSEGMTRLYEIGIGRLEFVQKDHGLFMGLDLNKHIEKLRQHFSPVLSQSNVWPNPVLNYPFIKVKQTQ